MDKEETLKKSAINLIFNIASIMISMGLSFWITPYLTNTIGSAGYGLVPLTQQFVNYMTVITVSITSISGRFFSISHQRGNISETQQYFSTTLYITLMTSLLLIIPFAVSILMIDKIINIPDGFLYDAKVTHIIFIIVFIITFITSAFNDGPFAENKLYYISGINIINILIKTVVTVSLCLLFKPKIWFVSAGILSGSLVAVVLSIKVFKKLMPDIKIALKPHNKVKEILSSGMWISISEIGVILFLQIDLMVANHFLSIKEAGEYAAVLQLPSILRTFSGTIISIFVPVVIALYGKGKFEEMKLYVNNAVKYTGIVLSLPIGILCGLGGTLLSLWINPEFAKYQFVLMILTIHLPINLSVQALTSIQTATARLKVPALMTIVMGSINLILACFFVTYMDMGVLGIALAGSIVLTCKNLLFTPIYVAYITKSKWFTYFLGVIKPFFTTLAISLISYIIQENIYIPNLFAFIGVCGIIGIMYLFFVWFFMISKSERILFAEFIQRKVKRR